MKRLSSFAICNALFLVASPVWAASQGTPGATSVGSITINASVTPEVNITNLDDITFSSADLRRAVNIGTGASASDAVCVWSNNPDGSYYITAYGDGASDAFILNDGTRTISYTVTWADNATSTTGGQQLTSATKSPQFISSATQPDCAGADTAQVGISLTATDIGAMESTTTYTGVLTLLVTPS